MQSMIKTYRFGLEPIQFFCGGGSPPPPPPPPPPPQLAKVPDAAAVRKQTGDINTAQGGVTPSTSLLSGGAGDTTAPNLSKKTLLGQ
jgi:hypothetical protein